MKSKNGNEDHLGPVNPFTLGNAFIEAALKLKWIEEEQQERLRRYFITSKGFEEMGKLGMDLEKALHYRPSAQSPEGHAHSRTRHHQHHQHPRRR
jgi:hypothetical protein